MRDQAETLSDLLHHDTQYPAGSLVLEAGCGVGAQTVTLSKNSPGARILAVDLSETSLSEATKHVRSASIHIVEFQHADLLELNLQPETVDHVFLCFVLKHVAAPVAMLTRLMAILKPGGTLCAIEGDHGWTFFHPDCRDARHAIDCLVELQRRAGGDALIGRRLYPPFVAAGLEATRISPRLLSLDDSRPNLVPGFTLNTFAAMAEGTSDSAVSEGLMDRNSVERGVTGLRRCAERDGVFCYTFFKAMGMKPSLSGR